MRIVSLLPSTTEILFAIGAGDDVVGVTFECDFPPEARSRRIVSTSAMPEGLTPAEIDAFVVGAMSRGDDLYPLDMPFVETLEEASHFRNGPEVYAGQIAPWQAGSALTG